MKRKDGYAPIRAYAAIGDGRTVALVAADGAIDFLSLPAMHAPTSFAALLDPDVGGRFALEPADRYDVEREYIERTNVLRTIFRTKRGVAVVTDALSLPGGGLLPWVELSRRVEGHEGEVPFRWSVEPRFDWGRSEPAFLRRRGVPVADGGDVQIGVHAWEAGDVEIADGAIGGAFTTRAGSRSLICLCCTHDQPIPLPLREDVERRLDGTVDVWRRWIDGSDWQGPWPQAVARSVLALKLLVYAPNGSIAAAPTTSLPERIGDGRNFDYRYSWVRDSAFTLDAMMRVGLPEQVHESFSCLLRAVRTTAPDLRPFYSLDGTPAERCEELPLRGYRDSKPVRYGNAASDQLQLGSWGDLLETADLYVAHGNALDDATAAMLADCIDRLCLIWTDEDCGMWEIQECRRYTNSLFAAWMAFDRAAKLVELGELPDLHVQRWRHERDRVRDYLEECCWSDDAGAYVEFAGSRDDLDAGILRACRMGWAEVAPERMDRTIDAIRERLSAGGPLLYRRTRTAGEEGAFVACSFWLAEALARRGRVADARGLMEELLELQNDVGLFAEEIDPSSHEFLGNFPQGLSHLALINAAAAIMDADG